ncbi:MAG: phenylalanine--tRNA ligase subunit beta [Tenericutes bacterium]|jgi:phenylalanyl-tRNA synthetase beta chain|nr:phenylalanine--tRNA ligase subunit beta [Mycoplasmatota bacterium]
MKISMNWLNDYLTKTIDSHEVERKFNLMSQEVEGHYPLVDAKELVIGYVETCVQHENADKLKVCQVNVGKETLQIICGAPNIDANQKVIVALPGAVLPGNFKIKKAKIRGVVSNGMICSLDELGVQDFDKAETGIYVLDEEAPVGKDPLEYMGLNDIVIDLDLTANRPDLLSMRGIAYDIKAMFDIDIEFNKPKVKRKKENRELNIFTETKDAPVYYGQIIDQVTIKESPYWLKSRLLAAGIRPISNVVDITNYVMLEYSQPLHAFDFDKIKSNKVLVRKAKENEKIITLDNLERNLLSTDIVITNGDKPIALAGVMGGLETEVSESTKTILLESAVFDPVSIRKTSKRLALKSEASSRYEKGINHELTKEALDRACELFVELADAIIIDEPSFYNQLEVSYQEFNLSLAKLNQVTGHTFNIEDVEAILNRLDFDYKEKNDEFVVEVPPRRLGFESYQDIIEEIVRIYGYDKIGLTLPATPTEGKLSKKQQFKRDIRNYFSHIGFYETSTYSLTNDFLATKYDIEETSLVKIMNPINKDREYLRHSTIPALTEVLSYNHARKIDDIFLFEIGKRYSQENEVELISGLMQGKYAYLLWQKEAMDVDFYLMKGILENLFSDLKISDYDFLVPEKPIPNLHPGISAEVLIAGNKIGWIGKLHPEEEKEINVKNVFVFELELNGIYDAFDLVEKQYEPIIKFPSVSRDIAVVVDKNIQAKSLIDTVNNISNNSLKSVDIFDVYQGEHLDNDLKSIAMSLKFENKEKTLETDEVDSMVKRIINALEKKHNAKLRQ